MVRVIGPKDPPMLKIDALDVTSHSLTWSRALSPFLLGPCPLYGSYVAQNVENGWQYAKVYPVHLDDTGEPSEAYWVWAKKGWKATRAVRYPMGKGFRPEYSYWNGEKLQYIEARKQIYAPLYAAAVRNSPAWELLKNAYIQNPDLRLWDFDGYDSIKLGSWEEALNDPNRTMGHAFVLAMMLEGIM